MSFDVLGLIFAGKAKTTFTGLDVTLDAAEVIAHSVRNTVSREVREDGSAVSDNVVSEPDELTVTGLVSDYPVSVLGGSLEGAAARLSATFNTEPVEQPSQTAWQRLKKAATDHTLVGVVTRLGTYEDMLIEDLTATQDRSTAHSLRFTARFVKMATATTDETGLLDVLDDVLPGTADLAAGTQDRGAQTAQVAP